MATQQAIAAALIAAKSVFPHLWKDGNIKDTATTWAMLFKDVPDELFSKAYFSVLQNAVYPPVPGEITAELKKRPMQNINSSVEWEQLVDAVDRTNDLRSRFGYTYVPIWATLSHGEQARHDARKVFYEMPKCLQDFIGSPGAMLQYAREMENMDHTGMQIRRRDYEKWRQDNVNKYSLPELIEMVGLLPEEERMLLGNE